MFLRGFNTIFDQEKTGFATANKDNCYASDDKQGVGSVEWAPVIVKPVPNKHTMIMAVIIIALVVCIIALIVVIIQLK